MRKLVATTGRWIALAGLALVTPAALATFHTYRIEQIYSNADGTIQFVVLKEALGEDGQEFWTGHALTSAPAGAPPNVFEFPNNLPGNNTANTRVLVGTAGFAALGIVKPDYVVPNHFLSTTQGSLDFGEVDFVTYSSLPTDGVMALDHTKQPVPNVATNFAGQSASVTAASASGDRNYEGLWWNSPADSEGGWGINFAHQGDVVFATWFTYDANRKAWWLSMTALKTADATYAGTLYRTSDAPFNAVPFDASVFRAIPVGDATLHFTDDNHGTFVYTVNGIQQTKTIMRQVFGPLPKCTFGATTDLAAATNYQDLWWNAPGGSENGWGINLTHQGDAVFATWFTYDGGGEPLWLSATALKTGEKTYSGELYRTDGPPFDAQPFDPKQVTRTKVGTMTLTFAHGNSATFDYTIDGIGPTTTHQAKPIVRQTLRAPGTVCQSSAPASRAKGLWTGKTSADESAVAIVLEDGKYYVIYTKPGTATDAGVLYGSSVAETGAFSSASGMNYPIAQATETTGFATPASLGGSYSPQGALQLTITDRQGNRTLSAAYVAGSDQPASLASAAGRYTGYTGHIDGRLAAQMTLQANGQINVANGACSFSGTIAARPSIKAFDWTVHSDGNCIFGTGPISGILYYDDATRQIHAFALFDDGFDQFFMIGSRT